jgi:hypothetical protein
MPDVGFRSSSVETYKAAASRRGLRLSDWLREACDTALKAEGFSTGSPAQQWALVSAAGQVMGPTTFNPHSLDQLAEGTPADAVWLPIENRDSAPFDPAQHWRLKPLPLRVDGDVVVREYPVIAKCQEHA